ncbi:MAG: hypothetical protein J6J41_02195 [Clostridia bacterium]|nr:hypothetical protein [Clostridia bacterium]
MKKGIMTRWASLAREIRLHELMKLIPDDEFVMIFESGAGRDGFQEEDAIFNGQVSDWWAEASVVKSDMPRMYVLGFQARETETVIGPVTMIVADY